MPKDYFVYIIECTSGRFYSGYTVDLAKRFMEHVTCRNGAKFTRSFRPRRIAASWKVSGTRGDAMKVESFIKSLTKKEKIIITDNPELLEERVKKSRDIKGDITVYISEK